MPGEFAALVQDTIAGDDGRKPAKIVLIDSLNGYLNAMPEERQHARSQLHDLFTFTSHKGVSTIVTVALSGMAGPSMRSPVDTSHLAANNVIVFRYFECFRNCPPSDFQ